MVVEPTTLAVVLVDAATFAVVEFKAGVVMVVVVV
jgi:hypothetical protein